MFCGSRVGGREAYAEAARGVGRTLAERGIGLVYGGGGIGLMGLAAQAAEEAGGEVIGVIPKALLEMEVARGELEDLRVVANMHERKALMADLSDGFVALPGGLGTFEELFEVLTWSQLGIHTKPTGVLDVARYYAPLRGLLDHAVGEGFLRPEHRQSVLIEEDFDSLLDRMAAWRPLSLPMGPAPSELR